MYRTVTLLTELIDFPFKPEHRTGIKSQGNTYLYSFKYSVLSQQTHLRRRVHQTPRHNHAKADSPGNPSIYHTPLLSHLFKVTKLHTIWYHCGLHHHFFKSTTDAVFQKLAQGSQLTSKFWSYSSIAVIVAIPHSIYLPVHEQLIVYSFLFPPHCPTFTRASAVLVIDLATQVTKP